MDFIYFSISQAINLQWSPSPVYILACHLSSSRGKWNECSRYSRSKMKNETAMELSLEAPFIYITNSFMAKRRKASERCIYVYTSNKRNCMVYSLWSSCFLAIHTAFPVLLHCIRVRHFQSFSSRMNWNSSIWNMTIHCVYVNKTRAKSSLSYEIIDAVTVYIIWLNILYLSLPLYLQLGCYFYPDFIRLGENFPNE